MPTTLENDLALTVFSATQPRAGLLLAVNQPSVFPTEWTEYLPASWERTVLDTAPPAADSFYDHYQAAQSAYNRLAAFGNLPNAVIGIGYGAAIALKLTANHPVHNLVLYAPSIPSALSSLIGQIPQVGPTTPPWQQNELFGLAHNYPGNALLVGREKDPSLYPWRQAFQNGAHYKFHYEELPPYEDSSEAFIRLVVRHLS